LLQPRRGFESDCRPPDIVVLDLNMPGQDGLSTLRRPKARWPLLPVLVFSMHESLPFVSQAMRAGVTTHPEVLTSRHFQGLTLPAHPTSGTKDDDADEE
jgi:CheY-like chemotaxis protein